MPPKRNPQVANLRSTRSTSDLQNVNNANNLTSRLPDAQDTNLSNLTSTNAFEQQPRSSSNVILNSNQPMSSNLNQQPVSSNLNQQQPMFSNLNQSMPSINTQIDASLLTLLSNQTTSQQANQQIIQPINQSVNQPSSSNMVTIDINTLFNLIGTLNKSNVNKPDIKIQKFNGNFFNLFKNDIERYLIASNKLKYIQNELINPSEYDKCQDMEVQLIISNNCIQTIKHQLQMKCTQSAYEMWKYLNQEYSSTGQNAINQAINYIATGQLKASKSLEDYINRFQSAIIVLDSNEYKLEDNFKIKFFFRGLGEHRISLEQHCIDNKFNFAQVLSYVRNYLMIDLNGEGDKKGGVAFNFRDGKKDGKIVNKNSDNGIQKKNPKKFKKRFNKNFKKFNKRKQDNVANTEPKKSVHERLEIPANKKQTNISTTDFDLISSLISTVNVRPLRNLWIFDTGASYNICNNLDYFIDIKYCDQPYSTAYSISGNQIPILGIGKVKLILKSGIDLILENVRYMPDAMASCMNHRNPVDYIKYDIRENDFYLILNMPEKNIVDKEFKLAVDSNLGPIIQLDKTDIETINFLNTVTRSGLSTDVQNEQHVREFFDSDNESDDKLDQNFEYSKLDDHLIISDRLSHNQMNTLVIHRRYGHPSPEKTKLIMNRLNLKFADYHCNLCSKHKLTKKINKTARRKAGRIIEIISSDTSGKFKSRCLDGSQYFIIFKDHFSKMCFIETFESKDQVPRIIENFVNFVQNKSDQKISIFRSDRGTEFTDNKVKTLFSKHGIQIELSDPDTHHQNGVAERMIRTIKTKANILLDEFGHLPKNLLKGEALKTACFLYNRTPNKQIGNKMPIELFNLPEWDLKLLPFGTRVYALNKNKKFKDDDNSNLMYVVGYDLYSKAYRLYDPVAKKIRVNNDISLVDNIGIELSNLVTGIDYENINFTYNLADLSAGLPTKKLCTSDVRNTDENPFNDSLICSTLSEGFIVKTDSISIPENFDEAISSEHSEEWKQAMLDEFNAMLEYDVWELVDPPKDAHIVKSKWVYTVKQDSEGNVEKFKARLVAAGWNMRKGEDYDEVFAPTLSLPNLRLLLNIALSFNLLAWVVDISTAYLNADIDKEVYMRQPTGFISNSKLVCRLKKGLYGLPQSGRLWFHKLADCLTLYGLEQCKLDETIFVSKDNTMIVAVYVDDIIIFTKTVNQKDDLVNYLKTKFKLSDKGPLKRCLGTDFFVSKDEIKLSVKDKVIKLAESVAINVYKKQSTPMRTSEILYSDESLPLFEDIGKYQSVIGSLLFIARLARPEILYAVNQLSKFSTKPLKVHYKAALKVVQYLFNSVDYVLTFKKSADLKLVGYTDSDWANDLIDRKSYTGFCIYFNNNPIAWHCAKQKLISQSADEAELIAANDTARELIYFKNLISEITGYSVSPKLHTDNAGVIRISDRGVGQRTKHISVKYLYLRELVKFKRLSIEAEIKGIDTEKNRLKNN